MRWEEIRYFFSQITKGNILDIWSWSWRLISQYREYFWDDPSEYLGVDFSSELIKISQNEFPTHAFIQWDMLDIKALCKDKKFKNIFLIASFHHLRSLSDRLELIASLYDILDDEGVIFMTNWDLLSIRNRDKYKNSAIEGGVNEFGSQDFNIKIGDSQRYYHSFSLKEIEYIANQGKFVVVENRPFTWEKNIITILRK